MLFEAIVLLTVLLTFMGFVGIMANYTNEKAKKEYLARKRKEQSRR